MSTLLLGIGNILFQDEGVGIQILEKWQKQYQVSPEVLCLDGGTLSFTLAEPIANADYFILIDSAQLHAEPGTVQLFKNQAMDDFIRREKKISVHEVSVIDLLDMARLTDSLPKNRALIGVQPHTLAWGSELTKPVAAALPQAFDFINNTLEEWGHEVRRY